MILYFRMSGKKDAVQVVMGSVRVSSGTNVFHIEKAIKHHQAKFVYQFDIGLLKLKGKVQFTDYIRPACLPNNADFIWPVGSTCYVTGWGATGSSGELI